MGDLTFRHLLAGMLLVSLQLAASPAGGVVIDFENLQPGALDSQYATLGVTFNGPRLIDYSSSGIAHSGAKAIELCFAAEFCTAPLVVGFTEGQPRVKLWVGYASPPPAATVVLRAFDANGALLTETSAAVVVGTPHVPVATPLEVSSASPDIRRVELSYASGTDGPSVNNGLVVDDVEFDVVGAPADCEATSAPAITLSQPANFARYQVNQFSLQGTFVTDRPLTEARMRVSGLPSDSAPRVFDLLASGDVGASGGSFGAIKFADALRPGDNLIQVEVANCRNATRREITVRLDSIPPLARFELLGLEVVQATQDLQNSVPLVSNKATIVRAYVRVTNLGGALQLARVTGSLTATPPGLPSFSPLMSSNAITVTSSEEVEPRRLNLSASLNFVLPMDWTDVGILHFGLSGFQIDGVELQVPCDGCHNVDELNYWRWSQFLASRRMNLVLAPYVYRYEGELSPDTLLTPSGALQWLNNAYPLRGDFPADDSGVRVLRILPWGSTDLKLSSASDGSDFLAELADRRAALWAYSWLEPDFHLLGVVPCWPCGGMARMPGTVAFVDTRSLEAGTVPLKNFESYGRVWAHELGHNLGRKHLSNDHNESLGGAVDLGSPYPHGRIGEPGLALNTYYWKASPHLLDPRQTGDGRHVHDFMSYGLNSPTHTNDWISPYTYRALYAHYRPTAQARTATLEDSSEKIFVAGRIKENGTAVFRPFQRRYVRMPAEAGTVGDYVIEFLDAAGSVTQTHRFEPQETGETKELSFLEAIPWKNGTRKIVLKRDRAVLAEREVSANTPWARVPAPKDSKQWGDKATIAWEAGDDDRDPLTFTVLYKAGDDWLPIAVGLKEPALTFDTRLLPGSDRARIRVEVTDGVNTAYSDSGTFSVAGKSPAVEILVPREASVAAGASVRFTGISYDAEDGMLAGGSLSWESDRDGPLGEGRQLTVKSLSPGKHTITLTATDRERRSGTARVTVTVGDKKDSGDGPRQESKSPGD